MWRYNPKIIDEQSLPQCAPLRRLGHEIHCKSRIGAHGGPDAVGGPDEVAQKVFKVFAPIKTPESHAYDILLVGDTLNSVEFIYATAAAFICALLEIATAFTIFIQKQLSLAYPSNTKLIAHLTGILQSISSNHKAFASKVPVWVSKQKLAISRAKLFADNNLEVENGIYTDAEGSFEAVKDGDGHYVLYAHSAPGESPVDLLGLVVEFRKSANLSIGGGPQVTPGTVTPHIDDAFANNVTVESQAFGIPIRMKPTRVKSVQDSGSVVHAEDSSIMAAGSAAIALPIRTPQSRAPQAASRRRNAHKEVHEGQGDGWWEW
ncbi:uncharacterized protein PAC_04778 [Phialocephala subalpina]|uniref:Uncharacterized protein n=1 Tax=Phialocephala subalpina TaxID=576137 RepID=A0A1L7WQ49_9HELO|nr:uncharacterized protein PAC_04778 [Phialocephala subalpina]